MEGRLIMENGMIIDKEVVRAIKSLKDGEYVYLIIPLKPKTENEYRRLYYAKLRSVCKITGDSLQDMHMLFKENNDIETTKDLTVEEWISLHKVFQSWIFNNLDIVI